MIRVLLIGRQALSLAGLRALITSTQDMEVVGQRARLQDALPPEVASPDLALVDHDGVDPFEPLVDLGRVTKKRPPYIVLTDSDDPDLLSRMFRLGARGLVFKHQSPEVLIDAVRRVHGGEMWLDRSVATRLITELLRSDGKARPADPTLSARDQQIVELVTEGLTNAEVASRIHVSEATIRNRLTTIFRKTGVTGRLQLVVYACKHGLVARPRAQGQLQTSRAPAGGRLRLV